MTSPIAQSTDRLTIQRPAALSARATANAIDLIVTAVAILATRPLGFTWLVPAFAAGAAGALLGGDSLGRRLAGITVTGTYGGQPPVVGVLVRDLGWMSAPVVVVLTFANTAPIIAAAALVVGNVVSIIVRAGVSLADAVTQTRLEAGGL